MTAPINDEDLMESAWATFRDAYDEAFGNPLHSTEQARLVFALEATILSTRATLQEPVVAADRAKVFAEIRGAVFREGIAHDRRLEVWLVDPYGEHPAQVHMPLIPWLNKTQEGEAGTP